jgi:hypothetical protein
MMEERQAQLAEFAKGAEEAFNLLGDLANQRSEKRIQSIDDELSAEQERIDRLQQLAAEGNEDAENNLALTEKRQAELELERKRQVERQQRTELALTAIQTYAGKVQADDPNPLASTISDISVLRAFINTLPGFYEGTEDTGSVGALRDEHGAITGFTHENERVLTAEQNRMIGPMSNAELASLAQREKSRTRTPDISPVVVHELRELKRITREKPVYLGTEYDQIADAVVVKIQKGKTLERIHKKNGGIWG